MRLILTILLFTPSAALAHIGHLGEVATHDHVLGAAALGIAVGVAAWGVLKGKSSESVEDDTDATEDEELAEA